MTEIENVRFQSLLNACRERGVECSLILDMQTNCIQEMVIVWGKIEYTQPIGAHGDGPTLSDEYIQGLMTRVDALVAEWKNDGDGE